MVQITIKLQEATMTQYTTAVLLKTKKEIILSVDQGKLATNTAANLLGITRQGLWKLRRNYHHYGQSALVGRKRGPRAGILIHNKTPEWLEEELEKVYLKHPVGPDRLVWIIEDYYNNNQALVSLSRSTIYRILVRRRLHLLTSKPIKKHTKRYTKTYPGEEVQLDTTEPFGKGRGTQLSIIDDYSRYAAAYIYQGNKSLDVAIHFQRFINTAPFPVKAVRVDNGSEFKKHFQALCDQLNIKIIRNRPNTPEHNGKVERLHRTIDEECLWRIKDHTDLQNINYQLTRYLHWYNTKRRHLGYHMNTTPRNKIETFIINNQPSSFYTGEVNETLILYILQTPFCFMR